MYKVRANLQVSQELNSSKKSYRVRKANAYILKIGALFMVILLAPHKKPCQGVKKLEIHKEFLTLSYKKVTSQKVQVFFYFLGGHADLFFKGHNKKYSTARLTPRDSKILPQHRRKGWPFPELISSGAVLR